MASPAPREAVQEGLLAGVVKHRTEGLWAGVHEPGRGGTQAHGTHGREGDTGQNDGKMARRE
jgi:hypothetical protein